MNDKKISLEKLVKIYVEDNVKSENKEELENIQNIVYDQLRKNIVNEVVNENKSKIIEEYKREAKIERKSIEIKEFEQFTINTILLGIFVGMLVNATTSLFEFGFMSLFNMIFVPWWAYLLLWIVMFLCINNIRKLLKEKLLEGKLLEEWVYYFSEKYKN